MKTYFFPFIFTLRYFAEVNCLIYCIKYTEVCGLNIIKMNKFKALSNPSPTCSPTFGHALEDVQKAHEQVSDLVPVQFVAAQHGTAHC